MKQPLNYEKAWKTLKSRLQAAIESKQSARIQPAGAVWALFMLVLVAIEQEQGEEAEAKPVAQSERVMQIRERLGSGSVRGTLWIGGAR